MTDSKPASSTAPDTATHVRSVTIDVEEYFHIEAAHGSIDKQSWNDWPSRVERNIDLLLGLFDRHNQRGTFFILGDVARRQPKLAAQIAAAGHEIASHGTGHDRLHRLNPDTFREDLHASKSLLEDQTGQPVIGYRAPTFSVVPETAWAIDVMVELGLSYDASIFPVTHPAYGVPAAPDRPYMVEGRDGASLLEVPPLTWTAMGKKLAVAGGGYFRLLPLGLMKAGLRQAAAEGRPAVLYFHPWEFDPDMPRMPLSMTGRIRTYTGLKSAADKLSQIMSMPGRWTSLRDVLPELRESASGRQFALAT